MSAETGNLCDGNIKFKVYNYAFKILLNSRFAEKCLFDGCLGIEPREVIIAPVICVCVCVCVCEVGRTLGLKASVMIEAGIWYLQTRKNHGKLAITVTHFPLNVTDMAQ